ncbi:MAG: winged helix-turn-helix domain-containing protein, partial [Anaerolineae bacterium]|nr:winged helix-turn-helix domain-containing protein [Anaerolineae bacterium]
MPRIEDEDKQELKQQIWLTIQQNPGLRTQDIATRLNLQVRRLNNYLRELRDEGKIRQEGWSWHSEEFKGPRLYRFELLPVQVVTLYLGARLLVKQ